MERFKVRKGQKPVRLAATTGHVTHVTEEWTDVPDQLVDEALRKRCIPESMFKDVENEITGEYDEGAPNGGSKEGDENPPGADTGGEGGDAERSAAILAALDRIKAEVDAGKEKTESGRGLLTAKNEPSVDAVAEYSGLTDVSRKEINAVLK